MPSEPPAALPVREKALYDALAHGQDVKIEVLFAAAGGPPDLPYNKQMWLGPYITKLNRRIKNHKLKVQPGVARGAYRLVSI